MPDLIYDNQPTRYGDGTCRHCDEQAHWSTWGGGGSWRNLCDKHLGVSLRKKAKLRKLKFETPAAVVTAVVGK